MDQYEQDLLLAINRVEEWNDDEITYEPIQGGITNQNWKVCTHGKAYFVKIPGKGVGASINRKNAHIANLIASQEGIGPQVFFYFTDTGVEIFEWLEGYRTLSYGDVFNEYIFYKIIDTIKKFHQHKGSVLPVTKSPFEQTRETISMAEKAGGYLPPEMDRMLYLISKIEESIMTLGITYVPCHVDHWTANYLFNEQTKDLKLVDYEYACMNDVGWDFAAMSTTNYFTEALDKEWIRHYFEGYDEVQFARLKLYKILSDINWTLWSSIQSVKSSVRGFDYHMWLGTKITRLRAHWNDPRLDYWLNLLKGKPLFYQAGDR